MNIYYDKDTDYAEFFFQKTANYGENISGEIIAFRSEKTDEIVGYAFENASKTVFDFKELPTKAKVAFLLKATRDLEGYTQEQVIKRLSGASGRQYQRAEAGENISLDVLDEIRIAFPEADFSKVFSTESKSAS